jgi:hypothetical protein
MVTRAAFERVSERGSAETYVLTVEEGGKRQGREFRLGGTALSLAQQAPAVPDFTLLRALLDRLEEYPEEAESAPPGLVQEAIRWLKKYYFID